MALFWSRLALLQTAHLYSSSFSLMGFFATSLSTFVYSERSKFLFVFVYLSAIDHSTPFESFYLSLSRAQIFDGLSHCSTSLIECPQWNNVNFVSQLNNCLPQRSKICSTFVLNTTNETMQHLKLKLLMQNVM